MNSARRCLGMMLVCLMLVGARNAGAEDWPQWRGLHRDGTAADFDAPATWPQSLSRQWTTEVGAGDATPALVGDKLYVFTRQGDDEVTLCLNAADGSPQWQNRYAAQAVTGPAVRHAGPRSSPAVAEGKVVTLGVGGVLSCLDAATGELVWRKDPFPKVVPQFYTASSPMIADGMAVAQLGGEGGGAVIAIDLNSGEQQWQWAEEGPEYASPVLMTADGTKQLVTLTDKSVVGIRLADGKLLWRLPFPPERRAYNSATPIAAGQTVIYTGAKRGTTAVKVTIQGDSGTTSELWSNPELAPQFNTPVLVDGLLFGLTDRGNLYCIDVQTGKTAWTDGTSRDRSGFGSLVHAGSVLLALTSGGEMVAFPPRADQYDELAHLKVTDSSTYAHPVVSGNRIFIKDQDHLTLWTLD